jgi:hypothetical protein
MVPIILMFDIIECLKADIVINIPSSVKLDCATTLISLGCQSLPSLITMMPIYFVAAINAAVPGKIHPGLIGASVIKRILATHPKHTRQSVQV